MGVIMVFLLQIGGTEEYKIGQGIKSGRITKPVVCWCIGTCATMFSSEVGGPGDALGDGPLPWVLLVCGRLPAGCSRAFIS